MTKWKNNTSGLLHFSVRKDKNALKSCRGLGQAPSKISLPSVHPPQCWIQIDTAAG